MRYYYYSVWQNQRKFETLLNSTQTSVIKDRQLANILRDLADFPAARHLQLYFGLNAIVDHFNH